MNEPRHDHRVPVNRRRGYPRRVATIVASWLAGGVLVVGVLLATGALGGGSDRTVTTIQNAAATTETVADRSSSGATDDESLYESTSPGVVEIKSKITSGSSSSEAEAGGSPFGESGGGEVPEGYGQVPEGYGGEAQSSESTATGSGFEVDDEGTVVTAAHVVDEASSVEVILQDGSTREAEVLGVDDATDLAVIRFDPEGAELHPLKLADSSALKVGASVAAIGAPFEYAWSFSTGIVSGLDRTIEAPNGFTVAHAIQTDAAVNPGNSGGPLLDAEGEVIGVVDQIATDGSADQSSGVGFAVPSNLVAAELQQLEAGETVEHAYLGVATATADESVDGAQVAEVAQGSPAAEAGLKQGDVITELDGEAVSDSEDLVAAIAEHSPGDKVTLEVKRGSESTALKATLGTQPTESSMG
jgi:putative serine protease PepD